MRFSLQHPSLSLDGNQPAQGSGSRGGRQRNAVASRHPEFHAVLAQAHHRLFRTESEDCHCTKIQRKRAIRVPLVGSGSGADWIAEWFSLRPSRLFLTNFAVKDFCLPPITSVEAFNRKVRKEKPRRTQSVLPKQHHYPLVLDVWRVGHSGQ